jgi:predicted ATP-binding protein involved in virulence
MKLTQVEIENFRCFERLTVPLEADVTAIIGINASGKTALLDAIALALVPLLEGTPLRSPGVRFETEARASAIAATVSASDCPASSTLLSDADPKRNKLSLVASAHPGVPPRADKTRLLRWATRRDHGVLYEGFAPEIQWLEPRGLGPASTGLYVKGTDDESGEHFQIPAMAYYRDRRNCPSDAKVPDGLALAADAAPAFFHAFDAAADFPVAERWFFSRENEELREGRNRQSTSFELPDLAAIRRALAGMLDGIERVYSVESPPRLKADKRDPSGQVVSLELSQLSAGQRNLLALTLDFARRLTLAHPAWDDPLAAPGILLIDEIELNLHPRWQQTVIPHLRRVFPNTQIIVATHSPQVLSTLERRQIRVLRDGKLFVPGVETYGADAARVQRLVMDTDSRPPDNRYVERLNAVLAALDEQRLADADQLLRALEAERGSDDPDLADARMQIENRKWEAELGI